MMVVDTSALMAIVLDEPVGNACGEALLEQDRVLISAGTVAEAMIVAERRGMGDEMAKLIDGFGFEVVDVTAASAQRVARGYGRWGKGVHPASLNFGDCFAYELAKHLGFPLLYVSENFSRTDVASVLTSC